MSDASSSVVPLDAPARGAEASELGLPALTRTQADSLTFVVLGVMGVALVLGLFRLGAPSFWLDESFTARAVEELRINPLNQYHWLYYWIETPWGRLFGTSEWALRLPSVVGAMAACGLLIALAARLFDRRVALASGLLLATNPLVVQWSQQARGYTMLVAFALAATLLLFRALDRGSRGSWALFGLAFTAVVLWHPVSGVVLAPALAILIAQRRRQFLPHGLAALLVIVAVAVPWAAQTAIRSTGEGVAMNWLKAPSSEEAVRTLLAVSGIGGLGLLFALLGVWVLRRSERGDLAVWLATWAFAPFVVALAISVARPIYLDRYLMVASPAFALLGGVAIMGVGARLRSVVVVVVVVATSVGLAQWYSTSDGGNWRGEDWRGAVAYMRAHGAEADAVVVAPWSAASAARYYGADVSDVSTADSIWVVVWSETGTDFSLAERRALGFGAHRRVEKHAFGSRVSVQLWQRLASST